MSIISLQEALLVMLAAIVVTGDPLRLYTKVRHDTLKTAIGVTHHAGFMTNTIDKNKNHEKKQKEGLLCEAYRWVWLGWHLSATAPTPVYSGMMWIWPIFPRMRWKPLKTPSLTSF
jgi:hypothetical protein